MTLKLDAAGVLGPDGKSYSFDHRGNGYSRGEGFGVLVLKRVSDAIRDGDTIRAVIRNSSSNQDGRSPGITQPTKAGQARLIKHVYSRAGLDPALTRFFEAHGTGTAVGDPIEASAISEVFTPHRSPGQPLYIGVLKSNVGHLEGTAGVAAIIKGVFTLERGIIPPNIWFEKPNPKIEDAWHLKFPTEPTFWPQSGLRRMSINSFGIGGSNAHVVMDDALHFLQKYRLVGNHRTETYPSNTTLLKLTSLTGKFSPLVTINNKLLHSDNRTREW
jgi:acyl transferase domain-containing protein